MREMQPAAYFPVFFFDGEREIDVGDVTVFPSIGFRSFLDLISTKIGIIPHQISVSLIRLKIPDFADDARREIPINELTNFAGIVREKDCVFHVVLNRSNGKRVRRRNAPASRIQHSPEKILLRRDNAPVFGRISPELRFLENERMMELQRQKEMYLMSINRMAYAALDDGYVFSSADRISTVAVCEECMRGKLKPIPFHWCVYDAVTEGFRSSAGPIQRPAKGNPSASSCPLVAVDAFLVS